VIIENTGTYTFQEAFDRTGRIINITIPPVNSYDPPRLLNYLTAPHICVWSAALASCHIPGVFDHTPLEVKEPTGEFRAENEWTRGGPGSEHDEQHHHHSPADGSVENELPMNQLSELFNVNHFIVSQVLPSPSLVC
jgi:TAG lipase / steryl ester hydrolase / phospholipase A2 / LPA acyltransferase